MKFWAEAARMMWPRRESSGSGVKRGKSFTQRARHGRQRPCANFLYSQELRASVEDFAQSLAMVAHSESPAPCAARTGAAIPDWG